MEVYRRSSWLLLLLGVSLLAAALQGVQGEAESAGPSESDCRPYIEKALKELGDVDGLQADDSKEDVPTVEITTDEPDHPNNGDDNDTHEDESSVESIEADQKSQSDKKEIEEASVESHEATKSVEETYSDGKDSHEDADTTEQKSEETDKKESVEDTKDESQEKETKQDQESKESSEDTKEVSQEVTTPDSQESIEQTAPSKEETNSTEDDKTDSKEDGKSDEHSKEAKEEVKIVKVEISKTEAEKPKEKKAEAVKTKEEKGQKEKIVVHPSKKDNKWWSFDSDEVIFAETQPSVVVRPSRKNNKWWTYDSKEAVEETLVKSESPSVVEPPRKRNKWWRYSDEVEDEEPQPEPEKKPKQKRELPKADESWKKHNKWWNVEESGERKDEVKVEVKKNIEEKTEKIETAAPVKKNKWWNVESGESEEKPIEKIVVEKKTPAVEVVKKNKWWNVEESDEKESQEKVEKPKAKIIREEPIIKMEIKQPVAAKVPKEEPSKVKAEENPVPKNKWWNVEESEEVKKEDIIIKRYVEAQKEESEEDESIEESGPAPEEELTDLDIEVPTDLRSRDHVEHLLRLDRESSETESVINRIAEITLKELKKLYETAIKPLEIVYKYRDLSNRHFGDSEIFSKPLILFMGPWSGGKSSIINYLLDNEYNETSLRTGAEPSPAYFNILMYGEEHEILDGTQLAADFTFSGLQKFGQGLEERLRGVQLPSKLLEKVNIVEIPGILEVRKQVSRVFPFNDACQWFIDRADIIFLVYDPSKLDVGPETEAILDQLKGREHQTRIILNKADQVKPEELMRVQGALIWNISPLMSSAQPPVMYTTSLWSKPYETWAPVRLLQAQERAFLRDFRSAIEKRIDNKIASARRFAVRVRNHAKMVDCYLTTYYNHKSVFGSRKHVADEIIEHPQNYHIYEGLSTLTNISRYDLPDPDVYKDFFKLNPLYDFQQLSATCTYFRGCPINRLDVAIAYDLPELIGKHKRMIETALVEANNPPATGS